ncbi:hypothetical protein ADIS_0432 [Lunatimonas lonarensis]|uniref:Uncharacterized protein n=2 Tax=Lunatimonas lonarensis TaxID=1232681 RepID=R7ZXY9_9BACT|nr:hypothetical protein ADIS_0432 [Lunatimonas lonarensis]
MRQFLHMPFGDKSIQDKQSVSSILLYYPVPDSLEIRVPESGWTEIPKEIKKHRLKIKGDFGLREYFHKD